MLKELFLFIKRNGWKNIFIHIIELYIGAILRILPGIEGLFLRAIFYKTLFISAGKKLIIYPNVFIIFSNKISVGNRVAINRGTYIDGRGSLIIGNNVLIGPNCVIATAGHGNSTTKIPMSEQDITTGAITIGDDVWIGANVVINMGVTLHNGSIIAAGSVVTKDIPEYTVYGGVPAKFISDRKENTGLQ